MATPEDVVELAAASEREALEQAAADAGVGPSDFEIVHSEALSRMPWQPKRFRFQLRRVVRAAAPVSVDGHWAIDCRLGSVWLTVYPPERAGRPVMPEELLAERRNWPVATFDRDHLYSAVEKAAGRPVAIAEYEVPKDRPYGALISPNDMAGYLVFGIEKPGEEELEAALATLAEVGIVQGIDLERVKTALDAWQPTHAVLVAEGRAPEPGENAEVLSTESPGSPRILPDGSADFSGCRFDEPIEAGEPLLRLKPVRRAREGVTVRGASIPTTDGVETDLQRFVGEGVELTPDGLQVVATVSGSLTRASDGRIGVRPLLRIPKSVDSATGNIDFPGNVVVDVDVADGVTVKATGDLTIKGVAMGAHLEAGGAMVLMNGMTGHGVGEIVAHGPLEAVFLQDCTVTSDSGVAVSREIVGCMVTAADSVMVTGEGKILGGAIQAGHEIIAKTIGTSRGVMTKLTVSPRRDAAASGDASGGRPSVRVQDRLYPPAIIQIGIAKWTADRETVFSRFVEANGAISVTPYA
ncbi:MAG: DUF342 domain-containing protein [Chloroflexi bacterium]|nr:DUF342 domain-containing protein [Chloroflexota bacterium]